MNSALSTKPAWIAYLQSLSLFIPSAAFYLFSYIFVFPRLKVVWQQADVPKSPASFIMDGGSFLFSNGRVLIALAILIIVACEIWWKSWPRFRSGYLFLFSLLFNLWVLTSITAVCISSLVAVPIVMQKAEQGAAANP